MPLHIIRQLGQPPAITEGSGAAGQPQNALPITIIQQSTPTESTPTTPTVPGSLSISSLSARPDPPNDLVMPYNGFPTTEGERAFFHLLRKENVDANWTWDQTIRAIVIEPLRKGEGRVAEGDYLESRTLLASYSLTLAPLLIVHRWPEGYRAGGKRGQTGETTTRYSEYTQREPELPSLHDIPHRR